ncbi:MAG TPA: ribonuclease Z [Gemmatimonadaceae bacterium]|nr:ribonuclease Z [Gemmatimonadaceae bacterium]
MSLTLRFLGTSASRPTVERNVSSLALVREGETMLFDCGEGTQRQMMRYGISFTFGDVFFSHFHADHLLGIIGLVRTMALQGRTELLRMWGPKGAQRVLRRATELGIDRVGFPVEVRELKPGEVIARNGFAIVPFAADHRGEPTLSYALVEEQRRGRFNPDLARELGIPEGPLWGQLHRGRAITLDDGRTIEPTTLVGPTRPGRKIVISGDTRPCDATVEASLGADILVHEATFAEEEAVRAHETGHSTARGAATVAKRAGAKQLILTHFSARYSRDPSVLLREAQEEFDRVILARDGMEVEVGYSAAPNETAVSEARTS